MDKTEIERRRITLDDRSRTTGDGVEYWSAREIMDVFGYSEWRRFEDAIKRAMVSAETSETPVQDHFVSAVKMVSLGSGAKREVRDYKLTRYACYLIAQNGDPRKEEIAFAQSYFAVQTRRQEVIEQRMGELRRLAERDSLSESEKSLAAVAFDRGVDSRGFAIIKSRGDSALFGGTDTKGMKRRLGVPDKKPFADFLPDVTIAAKNLANTMTAHNAEALDLRGVNQIGPEHVGNNHSIRETLVSRGIRPEELPAEEDAKKLRRRVDSDARKLKGDGLGSIGDGGK